MFDLKNRITSFLIRNIPVKARNLIVKLRNVGRMIPETASVNGETYRVLPHKFWIRFNRGEWEPDLNAFFKRHTKSSKTVLDIGGWQGASMFTAYSCNPKKLIVVEANPDTFKLLKTNCCLNNLESHIDLYQCCLSDKSGMEASFGPMDNHAAHTAINGIGGDGYTVKTTSLAHFLKRLDLSEINIIKIDVEGGERFFIDGLRSISEEPGIAIFLALHPPFWPDKRTVAEDLLNLFQHFELFDSKERPLKLQNLRDLMLSTDKTIYPEKTGQFFDIILKTRG